MDSWIPSAEMLLYYFRHQNQTLFGIVCRMPRPLLSNLLCADLGSTDGPSGGSRRGLVAHRDYRIHLSANIKLELGIVPIRSGFSYPTAAKAPTPWLQR